MTFERGPIPEHPADKLFSERGYPGLGDTERTYKGRTIQLRDYFDQPDINPAAKEIFEIVTVHGVSHPEYEQSLAVFDHYCKLFAEQGQAAQQP